MQRFRISVRQNSAALTVAGATVAVTCRLGWDVGALPALEAITGVALASADADPDDAASSI